MIDSIIQINKTNLAENRSKIFTKIYIKIAKKKYNH
jgi:hypothetical protein